VSSSTQGVDSKSIRLHSLILCDDDGSRSAVSTRNSQLSTSAAGHSQCAVETGFDEARTVFVRVFCGYQHNEPQKDGQKDRRHGLLLYKLWRARPVCGPLERRARVGCFPFARHAGRACGIRFGLSPTTGTGTVAIIVGFVEEQAGPVRPQALFLLHHHERPSPNKTQSTMNSTLFANPSSILDVPYNLSPLKMDAIPQELQLPLVVIVSLIFVMVVRLTYVTRRHLTCRSEHSLY
jgi:hypothetical protein